MRTCSVCKEQKPVDAFGVDTRRPSGRKCACRPCTAAQNLAWTRKNRDAVNRRQIERYRQDKNRLVQLAKVTARYVKHRERILASHKTERGRELGRARKRAEYVRRRDVILAKQKAWNKAHRDKRYAYTSQPHMRVHSNMSRAIRAALAGQKNGRKWEAIVGYTRADLVSHLASLFTDGMTWDNYGDWEIDHIRPRASFTFASDADQAFKDCWDLHNLQPLWMADNRRKWCHVWAAA